MPQDKYQRVGIVSIAVVLAITWLETLALLKGIDGTYFALALAALAGAGGFTIRGFLKR